MDIPHHDSTAAVIDEPATPTQAQLEAMFDQDEAAVAAGLVVSPEPVLANMRAAAERIRRERK